MQTVRIHQNGARTAPAHPSNLDAEVLAADLRARVHGEVRFDAGSRALYATDGSVYRQVPIGVVIPTDIESVVEAVAICRRYGAPILARGCGTSLEGQCCNAAVIIDMSKYLHQIIELDPTGKVARVQPGIICDTLRNAAEQYHLTFGPDPATHNHCTIGGMIGNDSCGVHSVMAGKTSDNIVEMEILTYDGLRMRVGKTSDEELEQIIRGGGRRGEIYAKLKALRDKYGDLVRARYPKIPRRVSGYNLDQLLPENGFNVAGALIGAEGTCVTVLAATTRLIDSPPVRPLLVLGYPDAYTAGDHVTEIMAHGPIGLEGFDDRLLGGLKKKELHAENVALLPEGGGWLLVEFGGQMKEEADARAHKLMAALAAQPHAPHMKFFDDPKEVHKVWEIRESAVGGVSAVPGEPLVWPGWEDASVPPERLGPYLRDFRKLLQKHGYECAFFGHFGQGCIHVRIDFDLRSADGIKNFRAFMYEAAELVVSYGGSLSGEHGDGQAHPELFPIMFGNELVQAFHEFKAIWDPDNKMNPGKMVNSYRMDQNLRLGTGYNPPNVRTHFSFARENYSFPHATLLCVGVGKCRQVGNTGTMCPSFMVTREEKHSTRGRARMLFEMLQGEVTGGGWRDEHVHEALDLCLACKGCKGECPVRVDMATYKAEFLSHYYAGRLRPSSAYALGLIFRWARLASLMPGMANFLMQAPLLSDVAKTLGGIAPERRLPAFAPQTFKQWFQQRGPRNVGQPKVILWPDTFNNYFHPETAIAAVEVLEAAGYQVEVPQQPLCCGRPLYDYGMLDTAEHLLRQILVTLRPQIEAGVPLVGLEPSCVAVFRDELTNLFPHNEDARRLNQQAFTLGEFLEQKVENYQPPQLRRKAIVHGHCHHKAIMKLSGEEAVLEKLGLDYQILDSGCCGMAGSFGFEKDHYDISIKVGERVLLPAVRQAPKDTLIIADGFSCREQIAQTTDRHALHLAQIIQMAMREGSSGPAGEYPEDGYLGHEQRPPTLRTAALAGATLLGASLLWAWGMRARRT
jgi:FAD/FMN-containing dehydrogenase/Fe-S oxidoreductase